MSLNYATDTASVDVFTSDLLPNERIEWTGRPNPNVIFHREDWGLIPFSLMWGGFAVFWLLAASGLWDVFSNKPEHGFQMFGIIWGTPFVVVGQYLIWGRFFYAHWKKKRTYYALTDRRALIVQNGWTRTSSSAFFNALSTIDKRVRTDGNGIISFGGPVSGEWRWGRNNAPRFPSFDDIDEADNVYQTVVRLQDASRKSMSSESPWGR